MTAGLTVDVWMQHPRQAMFADPMFDSSRRLVERINSRRGPAHRMDACGLGRGRRWSLASCARGGDRVGR